MRTTCSCLAVLGLCLLAPADALAQSTSDPARVLDGVPPDARLERVVTLDGYHPWEPPADLEAWKRRAERTRRRILVAAGLWPMPERTPLRTVTHGRIERDGYTIEKVFFESLPGFFVTGNLYRPASGKGRRPGVLCPHGHWPNGRLYERSVEEATQQIDAGKEKGLAGARYPLQARCAQLARMGCVVFHYDMVGNADSTQLGHAAGFGDVEAELRLQSAFGLQTWNSVRALDYLVSLPDVDPNRVGVTGASGGGTQTFILCAIDPRPAVGFPAVMVSTDMQGGCVCENASHLRVGSTNIEFAALAAPRPYAMTGANDWTREIMTKGLPELKRVWKLFGAEDLVEAWCYPEFEHNYNQVSRERMYAWFNRHLRLGLEEPIEEQPFDPVPPSELRVFDESHPRPDRAVDAAGLRAYLKQASERQIVSLAPRDAAGLAEFRRVIGGALEVLLATGLPGRGDVEARAVGETEFAGRRIEKLVLSRRESGESVPAILFRPGAWNGTVIVAVDSRGKGALCFEPSRPPRDGLQRHLHDLLDLGAAVLSPDLFLTGDEYLGELSGSDGESAAILVSFKRDAERHRRFVGYTYGYNRTLLAERIHDLLTAIAYARDLEGAKRVHLIGNQGAAHWSLLALALARDAVARTVVTERQPLDFALMHSLDDPDFLPGALKYGGMRFFTALCAPAELKIVGHEPLAEVIRAAYRAAGASAALEYIVDPGPQSERPLIEWLAGGGG